MITDLSACVSCVSRGLQGADYGQVIFRCHSGGGAGAGTGAGAGLITLSKSQLGPSRGAVQGWLEAVLSQPSAVAGWIALLLQCCSIALFDCIIHLPPQLQPIEMRCSADSESNTLDTDSGLRLRFTH